MLADLNMEMAARRHRLAGVFENAQEGLLQLRFIGAYRHENRGVVFGDLNARRFKIRRKDHGGSIAISSAPGEGTSVTIRLPGVSRGPSFRHRGRSRRPPHRRPN
jgi:hypothetical protein